MINHYGIIKGYNKFDEYGVCFAQSVAAKFHIITYRVRVGFKD